MVKFKRKKDISGAHPDGFSGIGIHALSSDKWMTIEQIMSENVNYSKQFNETCPPTWGELIRDIGLLVCFNMVEINNCKECLCGLGPHCDIC